MFGKPPMILTANCFPCCGVICSQTCIVATHFGWGRDLACLGGIGNFDAVVAIFTRPGVQVSATGGHVHCRRLSVDLDIIHCGCVPAGSALSGFLPVFWNQMYFFCKFRKPLYL